MQDCYQVNIIIPSIFIFYNPKLLLNKKKISPNFFFPHFQSVVIVYYDYYHPKKILPVNGDGVVLSSSSTQSDSQDVEDGGVDE